MAVNDMKLFCLLLVLLNGCQAQSSGNEDHFLQHLVSSVNKLMVQHAVDITNLENKLRKIERPVDITNLEKKLMGQHTADITNLEKKLHKQHDDMIKMKVQHAVDMKDMQNKLKMVEQPVNITRLERKLTGQHTADITNMEKKLHKQHDVIHKLMVQHAVDINNMEHKLRKQQDDMDKLKKNYTDNIIYMEKVYKEDMERMENKHAEDIKKTEERHSEDIEIMKTKNTQDMIKNGEHLKSLNESIKKERKKHSDDIQKLDGKHGLDMQKLDKKHSDDLQKFQAEHAQEKNVQNDKINKVSNKCAGDIQGLRTEVETKRISDLRKEASEMSVIRTKHGYDIQRLEKKHYDDMKQLAAKPVQPVTVGFHVALSRNQMNAPATVAFDTIINHYGNCWNTATKMFVAPVTGFYFFQMTIMNLQSYAYAGLMHGSKMLQKAYCAPHGIYHQATAAAMVKVNKGETVHVRLLGGKLHSTHNRWIHFVGFLIHQI